MDSKRLIALATGAIVLVIVLIIVFSGRDRSPAITAPEPPPLQQPEQRPLPPPPAPAPRPVEPLPEEPREPDVIPPPNDLENSDPVVLSAAERLAPRLVNWLTPEQQVRKWVVAVDNLAEGKLVGQHRPLAYPMASFRVQGEEDRMRMHPDNFRRTTLLLDTVLSIPPERLAAYYQEWRPSLQQAFEELGRGGDFDARLRATIDRMLAVEPLSQPPRLEQPSVYYVYADPELEAASDVEKLMWRLGPDNQRKVQDYLRRLRPYL